MGAFDFLKKKSNKNMYRPANYYTDVAHKGTPFEKKVITFEERKKISKPSSRGLYVAEILLLEYCSYGTHPNPQNGYSSFWWFEYGISDVDAALESLESRGYIEMGDNGKYKLTPDGMIELAENKYVPYMHKNKNKTIENSMFGLPFNVWSINQELPIDDKSGWVDLVVQRERELIEERKRQNDESRKRLRDASPELAEKLDDQDKQLAKIKLAEAIYETNKDIDSLIDFWQNLWDSGTFYQFGSRWAFRLPDLYIKTKQYDKALQIVKLIDGNIFEEKKSSYIEKIEKLKSKQNRGT